MLHLIFPFLLRDMRGVTRIQSTGSRCRERAGRSCTSSAYTDRATAVLVRLRSLHQHEEHVNDPQKAIMATWETDQINRVVYCLVVAPLDLRLGGLPPNHSEHHTRATNTKSYQGSSNRNFHVAQSTGDVGPVGPGMVHDLRRPRLGPRASDLRPHVSTRSITLRT